MDPLVNYYANIFNNITVYLHQYIGIPLVILGNVGNIICTLIFIQKTWRKNVCVFYFLICFILELIYINFITLGSVFIYGFNISWQNSNIILCKLFFYISMYISTLLPTILVLASIDRLLISSQNVDTRLYSSKRLAYFSISISTIVWFIFFIHVLIKYNLQKLGPYVIICLNDLNGFYRDFPSYSLLIINVTLFIFMIILSILSFKNVRQIRLIPRQQRQNIRTMHKKDFQLLRCLFVKVIVCIITSIFLVINTIYGAAFKYQVVSPLQQTINTFFFNFAIFFHHILFSVDFFIFFLMSKAFRQEIYRMIWKIFGKNLLLIHGDEHNEKELKKDITTINVVSVIRVPV